MSYSSFFKKNTRRTRFLSTACEEKTKTWPTFFRIVISLTFIWRWWNATSSITVAPTSTNWNPQKLLAGSIQTMSLEIWIWKNWTGRINVSDPIETFWLRIVSWERIRKLRKTTALSCAKMISTTAFWWFGPNISLSTCTVAMESIPFWIAWKVRWGLLINGLKKTEKRFKKI